MNIVINNLGGDLSGWHQPHGERRRTTPADRGRDEAEHPRDAASLEAQHTEHQRAVVGGLDRALQVSERAHAIVINARGGLDRVSKYLASLHLAVTLALDDQGEALEARKKDVARLLRNIDQVAERTRFGDQGLLDGSLTGSGETRGAGLSFVAASPRVRSSPPEGYPVVIERPALRAVLEGEQSLTAELLRRPLRFRLAEGDKSVAYAAPAGATFEQVVTGLGESLRREGLELTVEGTKDGRLRVVHARYGSGHRFIAESSEPGVLSRADGSARAATDGQDVAGTINGEPTGGEGEWLTGAAGNRTTDGLVIAYTGVPERPPPAVPLFPWEAPGHKPQVGVEVGRAIVVQRALVFRFGTPKWETVALQLRSVSTAALARNVPNGSGFAALAEIRVDSARQGRDALSLIARAVEEVNRDRDAVEELLRRYLMPALHALRVQSENLIAGESAIRDWGFADRVTRYLCGRMASEAGLAVQAQIHPVPGAVLRLIDGQLAGHA